MYCIGSDCHLSNGCIAIEPHLVASDGLASAKLDQCIKFKQCKVYQIKATDQIVEEGDIAILPTGINHKAANLAIL